MSNLTLEDMGVSNELHYIGVVAENLKKVKESLAGDTSTYSLYQESVHILTEYTLTVMKRIYEKQ